MNILAINGSPRKKGNSEILLDAVLAGVRGAAPAAAMEIVRLADLEIAPCIGCGGCDKTGKCVIKDDMIPLHEKIVAADRIIVASPIYFYGITAQAKAFVDRTQTLWSRQRLPGAGAEGWFNNPARQGFFISVAATQGKKVFAGAVLTMKYAFDAMGMQYGGDFLVKGVDKRGDMAELAEKLAEADDFGRKCVG